MKFAWMVPLGMNTITRRKIMMNLAKAGLLLAGWQFIRGVWQFLDPPVTQSLPQPVSAGLPHLVTVDSLVYIPVIPAWLGRDERGIFALSAICTHLGCTVFQTVGGFECPCHGSRFNNVGAVVNGPAAVSLPYLAVTLENGVLMIDPNNSVSALTRLEVF